MAVKADTCVIYKGEEKQIFTTFIIYLIDPAPYYVNWTNTNILVRKGIFFSSLQSFRNHRLIKKMDKMIKV